MILRAAFLGGVLLAAPAFAGVDDLAPVALNSLSAAPANLTGAKVLDQHGHFLGKVTKVQADANGHPSAVAFKPLNGKDVVVVSAAAMSFDGTTAIADDSQPQVAALAETRLAAQ